MIDKVVDASAIAAMAFLESTAAAINRRLLGSRLFAPVLLPFEMMNICLKKIRLHPGKRDLMLRGFANFQITEFHLYDVDKDQVLRLAELHRLSAYDASYLWLARHLGAELVTLDVRLEKAAASAP